MPDGPLLDWAVPAGRVPIWLGGQSKVAQRRVGQLADGWFPYYPYFDEAELYRDWENISQHAVKAGRDPNSIGREGAIYFQDPRIPAPPTASPQPQTLDDCVERAHWWKKFGAVIDPFIVFFSAMPRIAPFSCTPC